MSLASGALIVMALSFLGCYIVAKNVHALVLKIVSCLFLPFIVATMLYWIPTIGTREGIDEFKAWSGLFIGIWTVASIPLAFLGWFIASRFKRSE